ncbi:hypothetical protein [Streptomyces sp. DSM 40484]|uniref:hypothetical protein n=1 Tax=Streptomyces kroppenstedtii TaxID=3051181 RepID=UPI0028D589BC|nr:hypothetical protein [Streptomyces sp. DSM 40484]
MTAPADAASADDWIREITAQARKTPYRMFSVSVPLNSPLTPDLAAEHLVAATIEHVEAQNWQLDSVSAYGSSHTVPHHGLAADHWALLVFRTTYRGQV